MRTWPSVAVLIVCVFTAFAGTVDERLTSEEIVRLTEAGLGSAPIIAKIESSPTAFDTSVDALVVLAEKGVADDVIAAMVAASRISAPSTPASTGRPGVESEPPEERATGPAGRSSGSKVVVGRTFRDALRSGRDGPEMVVVPAGSFRMGCLSNDDDCEDTEKPVRRVTIAKAFAVSKYEVTFEDYEHFTYEVDDEGWGRDRRPVINVSWNEAKGYAAWLSRETGAEYRLLSEAEWEYAARAGTTTKYSWGSKFGAGRVNWCDWGSVRDYGDVARVCGEAWEYTFPVGSLSPNAFGLHDMHGNVWEWVEDCWHDSHAGAPSDGTARVGDCTFRVLRGGSWGDGPASHRSARRLSGLANFGNFDGGFRVARMLVP